MIIFLFATRVSTLLRVSFMCYHTLPVRMHSTAMLVQTFLSFSHFRPCNPAFNFISFLNHTPCFVQGCCNAALLPLHRLHQQLPFLSSQPNNCRPNLQISLLLCQKRIESSRIFYFYILRNLCVINIFLETLFYSINVFKNLIMYRVKTQILFY